MTETIGTSPDSGLYDVDHMPMTDNPVLRAVREKQLTGQALSMDELMRAGRDTVITEIPEAVGNKIETYVTQPDHVYRAVGYDALRAYNQTGSVIGFGEDDEFKEGENNKGVDWYLGGTALRYGEVVLEAPADPRYFEPAAHAGQALAKDPKIRHMKSSGHANPVPFDMVNVVHG